MLSGGSLLPLKIIWQFFGVEVEPFVSPAIKYIYNILISLENNPQTFISKS